MLIVLLSWGNNVANQYVQISPDGTGKKVQTFENTISTQVVEAQAVVQVDSAGAEKGITANPVKVDGSAVTQPISGSVTVSGTVTANAGTGTLSVSGPLTDTQLRATAVPVSGTVSAAQSGTWTVQPGNTANTTPWVVSGTVTANAGTGTLAVSAASLPLPAGAATAAKQPALGTSGTPSVDVLTVQGASTMTPLIVSVGTATGKTVVMKTGTLISTLVTADQVILTYTVTSGKTLYLQYFDFSARLTAFAATATNFGTLSLESPAATKLATYDVFHAGNGEQRGILFAEPLPVAAGVVIRVVCTPSAVTSMTWRANFGGYEK